MPNEEVYRSGLESPTRNDKLSVGTTSLIVSEMRNEANPRRMILIRNTSDNAADIITINLGNQAAVAEEGIVLEKGESFSDSTESGYLAHQGTITGICATANGQLSITER